MTPSLAFSGERDNGDQVLVWVWLDDEGQHHAELSERRDDLSTWGPPLELHQQATS